MRTSLKKLLAAALALGALGGRALGAPASEPDADAYIKRGVAMRRQHTPSGDAAAVQDFRRAYELVPNGRSAAQLGMAERQLKLWVEADKHLSEALRDRTDAWVRQNRPAIEVQLQTVARHVGRVVVGGEPTGADVFLNGQSVGIVPLREPAAVT